MNRIKMDLHMMAGRDRDIVGELSDERIFCSPSYMAINLEPHPVANPHQPSRFHSRMECSHPAFNPQETNLKLVWRTL
jgi:hypothetical protein